MVFHVAALKLPVAAVVGVHKVYIHVTLLAMKFSSNSYVDFLAGNKARQKRARNADSWINFWGAFCSCWVVVGGEVIFCCLV